MSLVPKTFSTFAYIFILKAELHVVFLKTCNACTQNFSWHSDISHVQIQDLHPSNDPSYIDWVLRRPRINKDRKRKDWTDVSTVFSYAAPVLTNEFQLRGRVDTQGRIHLALIIHGKHFPYKASFANDGAWHHICVTWSQMNNHWAIYVDGDRKDTGSGTDMDRDIHGDGILILGQDQDSFGGNFTEPFFGNITDLNVWNVSLETRHVRALNLCSATIREKLFSWNLSLIDSHHVVKEPSLYWPLWSNGS
uniref:Pentraxin family member n=1 Tax=Poecilia mexicana TaxID=48701 RepID=A0A3B3XH75_9TELE